MKHFVPIYSSVFTKFLAIFLAAILPISCIAIIMYSWQISVFDKATINNYETNMRLNLNNMEKELKRVENLCLDLLNNEDLLMLSSASNIMTIHEKTIAINRLFSRLNVLKNSSWYIKNINIYIPKLQRIINSSNNIYTYPSEQDILTSDIYTDKYYFSVTNNELYCLYLPLGDNLNRDKLKFIITVEFAKEELLKELGNGTSDSVFYLVDSQKRCILQSNSTDISFFAKNTPVFMRQNFLHKLEHKDFSVLQNIQYSNYLDLCLVSFLPLTSINPQIKILRNYFVIFIAVFIISTIIIIFKTYQLIKSPLVILSNAFSQMEDGNLSVRLNHSKRDEFGYIYHCFNKMVSKIQDLMEQVYKQKILTQQAQLKQLQSQINPHFLYNSFFVISNMARLSDVASIKRFSEYLAKYYQFITQRRDDDIPFSEEVEHSRIYVEIQKMRFGDRLDIRFAKTPASIAKLRVPRLILQPVIENVFQHGLKCVTSVGILQVNFEIKDNKILIIVEDNGHVPDETIENLRCKLVESDEISGIINIHKRLQLRYGIGSGVTIGRSLLGGLKVTITIMEGKSDVQAPDR